jgi:hypothetical protein
MEYSFEVASNAGKSGEERRLDAIAKFIIDNPGTPRHSVMRRFRLTSTAAENILTTLAQRSVITRQKNKANGEILFPMKVIDAPAEKEVVMFK